MPFADILGTEIFYSISGEHGPWITLLNGFARDSSDFKSLARFLASNGFTVLTLDNRGSGRTKWQGEFSIADMGQDVLSIWQTLQIKESFVVGFSMGGIIAKWLSQYPQTKKLAIVSSGLSLKHVHLQETWPSELVEIEKRLLLYFGETFIAKNKLLIQAMAKGMQHIIADKNSALGMQYQRQAVLDFLAHSDQLKSPADIPTLLLHGEKDQIISVTAAWAYHERTKDSIIKIYPQAGHLLLAECFQDLCLDLLNFFNKK